MGWNGSSSDKPASSRASQRGGSRHVAAPCRNFVFIALTALLMLFGGGLAAYLIFGRSSNPDDLSETAKSRQKISEVKSVKTANPVADEDDNAVPADEDRWLGVKVDRRTAVTNGTRIVETIYTVDGKCHKYFHTNSEPVFDNLSDQVLALATAETHGGVAPPLPGGGRRLENAFAESLKREIVINKDDSDEVKSIKERVRQARKELLDAMSEGMSAQEVLDEHRMMQERNAGLRMEAVKGLKEYLEKGDVEGAQEYCEKINKALDDLGIMRIELPRSREEIIAERQLRNAELR